MFVHVLVCSTKNLKHSKETFKHLSYNLKQSKYKRQGLITNRTNGLVLISPCLVSNFIKLCIQYVPVESCK